MLTKKPGPSQDREGLAHKFMQESVPDEEQTKQLYFNAVEQVKTVFGLYKEGKRISKDDVIDIGQKIVNNIILGSGEALRLVHELDSLEQHRYYNAVNVSILSVHMGIVYNYNKSTLLDLAIIGLLHDMALIKHQDAIDIPSRLTNEQLKEIRKHPLNIATYVDVAFNFKDEMVKSILQHHERKKGQGYPEGLTESDIHELAMIVGLADTYEAITHARPYKKKSSARDAILNIINNEKDFFSKEVIKALVTCVGLFPTGTWAELNTGEICKVLSTNPDAPLRPVVSILMDKDKNRFREIRTIDLSKMPSLYIKREIEEKTGQGD